MGGMNACIRPISNQREEVRALGAAAKSGNVVGGIAIEQQQLRRVVVTRR